MRPEIDTLFIERAVALMQGIGVHGVTVETILSNRTLRAQFRAMLHDARARFTVGSPDYEALIRLSWECDQIDERMPAVELPRPKGGMKIDAGGTGFQVPSLYDDAMARMREKVDDDRR